MTVPSDRLAYLRTVVLHRCGDVLTDRDLALMAAGPDAAQPAEIAVETAGLIMDVLDQMMNRLDALVETVASKRCEP
jgi:hypothetical protein